MVIVARDFKTSSWIEIEIRNGIIAAVRPLDGPAERNPNDDWVGPAFWDIQLRNGPETTSRFHTDWGTAR